MTREETAVQYMKSGYNCCQSVVKALGDLTGIDQNDLNNLASGFGMGMGCLEATCGALVGAVMMIGPVTEEKKNVLIARQILKQFEETCGATLCKDLKGQDTGVVLCSCPDCVRNAVRAFCDVVLQQKD